MLWRGTDWQRNRAGKSDEEIPPMVWGSEDFSERQEKNGGGGSALSRVAFDNWFCYIAVEPIRGESKNINNQYFITLL